MNQRGASTDSDSFVDDFDGPALDEKIWFPHYLPQWSSRAKTAASYRVADSLLVLDVPIDHNIWCEGLHQPPIRVSGMQSGTFSGPLGSTIGQQPFAGHPTVMEEQDSFRGLLVTGGRVEMRAAMTLSPRSMAALWLVGFEDEPQRCGEICVAEIFGRSIGNDSDTVTVEVGMGVHPFRDPELVEDFATPRVSIDPTRFHDYAVVWRKEDATFLIDGVEHHRSRTLPRYPLQLMLAVFDFPEWSDGTDGDLVPELAVDWIRATADL